MPKRPPRINVHCHLLCLEFIPNKFSSEVALPEMIIGSFFVKKLAGAVKRRAGEFLGAFSEKVLCKETIADCYVNSINPNHKCDGCFGDVIKNYVCECGEYVNTRTAKAITQKNTHFDIYVPLMMDLEWGANSQNKKFKGMITYEDQVKFISEQVKRFPFRLFPFIMFDPRRDDSFELCKKALEELGFAGIKMYPPMGYFPNSVNYECLNAKSECHDEIKRDKLRKMALGDDENDNDYRLKEMDERLEELYNYCEKNSVPITTHAGSSGAYDIDMTQGQANTFSNIDNWQAVLEKHPKLKLNFAHFGGNYIHTTDPAVREQAETWRKKVTKLLKAYKNVYADISYHNMGLESNSFGDKEYHQNQADIEKYFFELEEVLESGDLTSKILFGTDTPMISHTWSEKDYVEQFKRYVKKPYLNKVLSDNPARFLFGKTDAIPEKYIKFIKKYNPEALEEGNLPDWIEKKDDEYFIAAQVS